MERKNEKHIGLLFSLAFVFQVCFQCFSSDRCAARFKDNANLSFIVSLQILLQVLTLQEAVCHRTRGKLKRIFQPFQSQVVTALAPYLPNRQTITV